MKGIGREDKQLVFDAIEKRAVEEGAKREETWSK